MKSSIVVWLVVTTSGLVNVVSTSLNAILIITFIVVSGLLWLCSLLPPLLTPIIEDTAVTTPWREWTFIREVITVLTLLVGNVVAMLPACRNVSQMLKIFEIDTNVHDTENFFYSESRVCGMSWSQIVSDSRPADKKIYLRRKYFFYA